MKYETVLVSNDWQIPFHDERALGVFYKFAKDVRPDKIILAGDIIDFHELSSFSKDPLHIERLDQELDIAEKYLKELRRICPKAEIEYLEGNHEFRIKKYIFDKADTLGGSSRIRQAIDMPHLLGLYELDIKYIPCAVGTGRWASVYTKVGDLYVGHFNQVKSWAGMTAKGLVDKMGVNVMQGHTHRMGSHIRKTLDGRYIGGWENGCLCDLSPKYTSTADWCHGWSVVIKKKNSKRFQVIQLPLVDYETWYGGKRYA